MMRTGLLTFSLVSSSMLISEHGIMGGTSVFASATAATTATTKTTTTTDSSSQPPPPPPPPRQDIDPVEQMFKDVTSSGLCDLPVLEGTLSGREFRTKYWNKSPVIIRGMAKRWPAVEKWTKEYLVENFGEIQTQIGTSTGIIRAGGTGNEYVAFGDYVEKVWGPDSHKLGAEMPKFGSRRANGENHPEVECRDDKECVLACNEHGIASESACTKQMCFHSKCTNKDVAAMEEAAMEEATAAAAADHNSTIASNASHRYGDGSGEVPYLFDRENFFKEAVSAGITMDLKTPSFFRTSELASMTFLKTFMKKLTVEQRQMMEMQKRGGPSGGAQGQQPQQQEGGDKPPSHSYIFLTPKFDRLVGVGMHQHTDGWNAHLGGDGVKLWFLYPPSVKPGPEHPVKRPWCCGEDSWVRSILPTIVEDKTYGPGNMKPLMCTQELGDIVYVPEWWHHATLTGPGPNGKGGLVGVAAQLGDPSGDLHFNYEARVAKELRSMDGSGGEKLAKELYEKHVALGTSSSHASAMMLVQMYMEKFQELKQSGVDEKEILSVPEHQDAKDLLHKELQHSPEDERLLATACEYSLMANDTATAMKYVTLGAFFFFFCGQMGYWCVVFECCCVVCF